MQLVKAFWTKAYGGLTALLVDFRSHIPVLESQSDILPFNTWLQSGVSNLPDVC